MFATMSRGSNPLTDSAYAWQCRRDCRKVCRYLRLSQRAKRDKTDIIMPLPDARSSASRMPSSITVYSGVVRCV